MVLFTTAISDVLVIICSKTKKERGANDDSYPFTSTADLLHHFWQHVVYWKRLLFFTLFQVYNDIMAFPGPLCEAADIKVKLT